MSANKQKNRKCLTALLAILLGIGFTGLLGLQHNSQSSALALNDLITRTAQLREKSTVLLSTLSKIHTDDKSVNAEDYKFPQQYNESKKLLANTTADLKKLVNDSAQLSKVDSITKVCNLYFSISDRKITQNAGLAPYFNNPSIFISQVHTLVNSINETASKKLLQTSTELNTTRLNFIAIRFVDIFFIILVLVWLFSILFLEMDKRKKAQEELFVSREWLSQTLYCMGDAVITTNAKGEITFLNKVAEEFTGRKAEDSIGMPIENVWELLSEEDKRIIPNPVRDALSENKIVSFEGNALLVQNISSGISLEKTYMNIDVSAAPISNKDGKTIGAVMIFRDITEQAITRKILVENEKLLQDIVNNTNSIINIKDLEGNYLMLNKQYEKVFNIKVEDMVGQTSRQLLTEDVLRNIREMDLRVIAEGRLIESEQTIKHGDGTFHDYSVTKFPLFNCPGEVYAVCTVSVDITESKENIEMQRKIDLQEALLKKENQYAALFQDAPVFICILIGKDHVYQFANPPYLKLANRETIVGKTVAEIFPEVKDQGFIELLDNVYNTGQSFVGNEVLVKLDHAGMNAPEDIYMDLLYQPYRNSDNLIEGIFVLGADVTEKVAERKKNEKADKRFKALIENSEEMLILTNETGRIKYHSPAVERNLGRFDDKDLAGKWLDLIYHADVEKAATQLRYVIDNPGIPVTSVLRNQKKDGSYLWVEGTITNMMDLPEVNAIVANFRDITQQKVDKEKIDLAESLLSEAQTLARIGNWNFDAMNNEVFWSSETRNIYGVDDDFQPSFEKFIAMVHPDDQKRVREKLMQARCTGEAVEDEYRIIRPDGRQRTLKAATRIILDESGKLLRTYGTSLDITELKNAQLSLQQSETNLRTIYDNTNIAYVLLDNSLNIVSCNKLAHRFAWENLNAKISEGAHILDCFPKELKWQLKRQIMIVICSNNRMSYDKIITDINGNERWFSIKLIPVADTEKSVFGTVIAIADITERKLSELEREKITNDLIKKNKDLNTFAYMVSHNLRAPISKILGLSDIINSDPENQLVNQEYIHYLTQEVESLDNVVKEMNTIISTRDSGNILKEEAAFKNKLNATIAALENQIQDSDVLITSDFNEVENIITVKSYLYSIIYNLVSNAIKYRSVSRPLKVHLCSKQMDQFVCLSIEDNGSGIDLEKNGDKLFGLHKRFHNGNIPGRGVGLTLVKAQVESLGGRVEVESKLKVGTTFKIYLPKN